VKSLVGLLEDLLLDCGRKSGAPVHRDVKTLRARVDHEGDSFITITLPAFCSDFERSLELGAVGPGLFAGFAKRQSGIPAFLQGFLSRVFDKNGILRSDPSVDCIRSVRQICLFGKKILRPCSDARLKDAIDGYVRCDDEVAMPEGQLPRYFEKVAAIIMADLRLADVVFETAFMPKHGPGATQEHISGNAKWRFLTWHSRLDASGIEFQKFARGTQMPHEPDVDDPQPALVEPEAEPPVRVVFVPKTLKTPRVIAVEPVCMQFAQQGLKDILVQLIERSPLTAGHVNFTNQCVNQEIAFSSSSNRRLATLDMKEASDRVGLSHVEALLKSVPGFRDKVMASRSARAKLPDGREVDLRKFASMGSALCFPIEALVFYTSIIACRIWRAGRFPTRRLVSKFSRDVFVYGDDLIVPADEAPTICDDLETFGFRVNRRKSFWTGKFRESCGADAYDGELVTPVYLRRDVPADRRDVNGLLSTIATANQLFQAGYWRCATALQNAVEHILGKLPRVDPDSPAIGWHHHSDVVPRRRWNRALQRLEHLCFVPETPREDDPLEGYPALAKCFRILRHRRDPLVPHELDEEHLETSPRPYSLALKRRWVPAHI